MVGGGTLPTMYIHQEHNHWPRTPARTAARLRQVVSLPDLTVSTRGSMLSITWVEGPAEAPVFEEFRKRLNGVVWWRGVRLYRASSVGAALIHYWERSDPYLLHRTWGHLSERDLDVKPLPNDLRTLGAVLAGLADVPPAGLVGWHRRRWDVNMWATLVRLGGPGLIETMLS